MLLYFNPNFSFAVISMVVSIYSASLVGKAFLSKSFIGQVVVGLTIFSIALSPLTYLSASLFRPVGMLLIIVPLLIKLIGVFINSKSTQKFRPFGISGLRISRKFGLNEILITLTAAISIYFCQDFFPHRYIFETHDVLYLGWLDGFWNAKNSGALIVNSAFPQHLGSFHVQPSVLVAVLGIFSPTMNLLVAQFIKAVFLTIFFSSFFLILIKKCNNNLLSIFLFLTIFFLVAGRYIGYSLGMSSYLYVIILILICMNVFWRVGNSVDLWILFSLLIVAKAPIFLVAAIPSLFLLLNLAKVIPVYKRACMIVLTILGVSTWLLGGQSSASPEGLPTFFGVLPNLSGGTLAQNSQTWLGSFSDLNSWMMDYVGRSVLPQFFGLTNLTRANIIWIVLSVYILYYLAFKVVNFSGEIESNSKVAIHIFMLSSLLSLLFIRNGAYSTIAHQNHAYYLSAVVTSFAVAYAVSKVKKIFVSVGLIASLTFLNLKIDNFPILKSPFLDKIKSESSVRVPYQGNLDDFLGEQMKEEINLNARRQVLVSLLGEQLLWENAKEIKNSQLNRFLTESQ